MFDYLKQGFKKTEKGIDIIISTLSESVNQVYEKILSRSIEEHKIRKILSIILTTSRLLILKEMNIAVNIEFSLRFMFEKDLDLEKK